MTTGQAGLVASGQAVEATGEPLPALDSIKKLQQAFGYTVEEVKMLMSPMAANGEEAVGSMGTADAPGRYCRIGPKLVSNISSSCSRRLPTRPSTPSGKS